MATIANAPKPLQIPVIDINGEDSEQSIADQLVSAATIHGFVYIKNLGENIPIKDIDHTFELVLLNTPKIDEMSLLTFVLVVQEVLCIVNRRETEVCN